MHIEKRFPGELRLCHRQWTKNPAETTGKSYKNVNLVTRTQKWMGSVGCFGQIENIKRQSLWYGICVPCAKRLPGVRDAFSEAFGVKNRLLRYGRDIRCQKQAPVVRDAFSKARRIADSTDCGQPAAAPDASSVRETPPARRSSDIEEGDL